MSTKKPELYSPKSIVSMVCLFFVLFWLLYSIASFLHESRKIQDEIAAIRETNVQLQGEIESKKQLLAYLKTPQRIEKEAKMQMGKRLPGENVIVLIEEEIDILPTEVKRQRQEKIKQIPNWEKWHWLFLSPERKVAF